MKWMWLSKQTIELTKGMPLQPNNGLAGMKSVQQTILFIISALSFEL
jgi:hypothetical protein